VIASFLVLFLACFPQSASTQTDADQVAEAKKSYGQQDWAEILRLAPPGEGHPAELDFYRGLALARLKRWDEAKAAFETGRLKAPGDKRFAEELAGIAYQQKDFRRAQSYLKQALRLDPRDSYARDFLATLYFLDGNLDATLLNWNRAGKPKVSEVKFEPQLQTNPILLDRAFSFSPLSVLRLEELRTTRARLDNLGIFPDYKFELRPESNEAYSVALHATERNAWGDSKLEAVLSVFRGVPYQTVYPEYYNLRHSAINATSLIRWDAQKRRAVLSLSSPLAQDPKWRLRVYVDGRNENWDIRQTLQAATSPISGLKLEKVEAGAEVLSVVSGRWTWQTGFSLADRKFLNFTGVLPQAARLFTSGLSVAQRAGVTYRIFDDPERRMRLETSSSARIGKVFAEPLGPFGQIRGSLAFHWLPQRTGDDYEMTSRFRAGRTLGLVPFDELFQLGVERDNDLWLRGHAGTQDGKKGSAPIGRNYLLWNWEMDKIVFQNGLFAVKLGPFVDMGRISDPSRDFVNSGFLVDPGAQCKVRVLGAVTVVFSYGRNLHSHRNAFYATALH